MKKVSEAAPQTGGKSGRMGQWKIGWGLSSLSMFPCFHPQFNLAHLQSLLLFEGFQPDLLTNFVNLREGHLASFAYSGGLQSVRVSFGCVVPIDDVPKRFHVLRPAILILEIISMFPHIDANDRDFFLVRFGNG